MSPAKKPLPDTVTDVPGGPEETEMLTLCAITGAAQNVASITITAMDSAVILHAARNDARFMVSILPLPLTRKLDMYLHYSILRSPTTAKFKPRKL